MKHTLTVLFVLLSFGVACVKAQTLEILGNGNSSEHSITANLKTQVTIPQHNTSTITNTIKGTANTGNNTSSGNSEGSVSIVTGDSSVSIHVNNLLNSNSSAVHCCTTPTPTIKPTTTPLTQPSIPQPTSSSINTKESGVLAAANSSGPIDPSTPQRIGGGDILGLSETDSIDWLTLAFTLGGVLCLSIGSTLVGKKQKKG